MKRPFPYPLATVLVLILASLVLLFSSHLVQDALIARKLRRVHAEISGYLAVHNFIWPGDPTLPGPGSASPWWCPTELAGEATKFRLTDSISNVPNEAYRWARRPWVTYTDKDGRMHHVFPDGSLEVRR